MRQVSIPKNIVDALNELFDAHPEAMTTLVEHHALKSQDREQAVVDSAAGTLDTSKTVGVLDVVNAILDKLHPGKRIAVIQGSDGFEGFTLARDRKPQSPQSDECDS